MSIQFRILESALKPKQQVFKAVGPLKVTTTVGSPNVTVATVGAGERDPISEIKAGMDISTASIAFLGTPRVLSVNTGTRVVTMNTNASFAVTSVQGMFGRSYLFTVPSGVYRILASWIGGGLGGSGGYTSAGAGGGGGGASSAFQDFLLPVEPGEVLTIQLACGGLAGAVNTAAPANGGSSTTLDTRSNIYTDQDADGFSYIASSNLYLPTARPTLTLSQRSAPGTAADGGRGGDGGPAYTQAGGPAGGTGGAASVNAANGAISVRRGQYGWTGGAGGGGGGPSASAPGDGGTDMVHTDGITNAGSGLGGHGGSSAFGKGGWGGDASRARDAVGYGSGGGGGATGFGGGNGAPGWASLSWV